MVSARHPHEATAFQWQPTRQAALEQLQAFLPQVHAYARERNYDRGQRSTVSRLSPYLRHRLITEEEVIHAALGEAGPDKARKFIEEVCWRTYFKGYLNAYPGIWDAYVTAVQTQVGSQTGDLWARVEQARQGRTGIRCFDEWAQELRRTGYLHNHTRMWFASTWVFTLGLPWQLGAALFSEFLVDADPASNTLGWRWVAGLHTVGKAYAATAANIARFTDGHYNPVGQLNEHVEPLPNDGPFPFVELAKTASFREGEAIDLSLCPAGLLICPEDLSVEHSQLAQSPFSSIAVLMGDDTMQEPHARVHNSSFITGAVADAGERVARHWGGVIRPVDGSIPLCDRKACADNVGLHEQMRIYCGRVDHWVDSVVNWATNETLHSVWLVQPAVGPYADRLSRLRTALQRRGITLCVYRRRWDSAHWPFARGSYYKFRKDLFTRIESLSFRAREPRAAGLYQ